MTTARVTCECGEDVPAETLGVHQALRHPRPLPAGVPEHTTTKAKSRSSSKPAPVKTFWFGPPLYKCERTGRRAEVYEWESASKGWVKLEDAPSPDGEL